MRLTLPLRNQRGDTIVEVLICIAILSMILGGAFVMTNRSLQGTRQSQERLNATKLVEGQLEQVKHYASTDPDVVFNPSNPSFCFSSNGIVRASNSAACAVNAAGAATTAEPIFRLSITRSGQIFTVKSVWNNVSGSGQNNVEMKYKIYE